VGRQYFEMDLKYIGWEARNGLNSLRKDASDRPLLRVLTHQVPRNELEFQERPVTCQQLKKDTSSWS